jgi:ABC-type branched-subunit amino acid transport system ATPase component
MSTENVLLEVEGLRKSFGGVTAVDGADFEVERGSITGLIGPNGAGKSTTLDLLTGFQAADSGTILFDGEDISGSSAHHRARSGIVRTFQIPRPLAGLTLLDNMLLGAQDPPDERAIRSLWRGEEWDDYYDRKHEAAEERLRTLELWEKRELFAGNLSGGQQKLLELGRALMAEPDVLLLDEPTAGVNPELTDQLIDRIEQLQDEGMTFLIVEHDIEAIMRMSDNIIGMVGGQVMVEGEPSVVQEDSGFLDAYLGGSA